MIISSLRAENLLKYRRLRLDELPERGVIAVSGDNESGKSAVGEIICFALFGRTYSLAADDLSKLVRWGATQGRVALSFSVKDRELEIIRHIDRGGMQSARLLLRDQPQEPMARGLAAVNEQMQQILGYDFDEYIDTFYLAQREITTPHAHSPSVKAMAGIAPFEQCAAELSEELRRDEESARQLNRQSAEIEGQLALLDPPHVSLEAMEDELTYKARLEQQLADRTRALESAVEGYSASCKGLRSHTFRQGLVGILRALIFLLLVAALGVWALLLLRPNIWPLPAIGEHLQGQFAAAGLPVAPILVYAVFALSAGLLLTWLWTVALNLGMRKRRARARHLADELRLLDELEPVDGEISSAGASAAQVDGEGSLERPALVDRPDSERRTRLAGRVLSLQASAEEVRAASRHEIAWMGRGREALVGQREVLSRALICARQDKERGQKLRGKREELAKQIDASSVQMKTARLALELVQGAMRRMTDRFNEQLRNLVSRNLPQFTDGRYQYLQVGDDLEVRVYSNEKRSFLDLEEISSGTQRQIMLALRLALAQEQLSRIAKDRQFAFLDEPFAFFDDTRMRGALRLLPELSELITQHWVVAQRFPRDEFLALEIPCVNSSDALEIGMARLSDNHRDGNTP